MDPQYPAVGIDLGTTNSVIASLDAQGRPQTLVNAEGEKTTPSAILFDEDEAIVGVEAIKGLSTEADRVAIRAKREIGLRHFPRLLGGRQYPPEVLQAFILNKLRVDASRQIGPIRPAVVTVPAYFDEMRRQATLDAGYIAGLDVVDIINEPTAAAVAYSIERQRRGESPDGVQRLLVYDLGGGTFDVTVLEYEGSEYTALATDGDVQLGGCDWDDRLLSMVTEAFRKQHGIDPQQDPHTWGRLARDCEDAKRTLTARDRATVVCQHAGHSSRIEITREAFEERTADLLERTKFTVRETLDASGLDWDEMNSVLLVGGATRMPAVKAMLAELSGRLPATSIAADEVVAHGAAIHAGWLAERAEGKSIRARIQNINSHSLGVVGTDPTTRRERVAVLVPRNTPIPVTAKRTFKTKRSHQQSILVRIVEGESSDPEQCVPIGDCVVDRLPPKLPAQTPIEVRFCYEQDGRLAVDVDVAGTGRRQKVELMRENALTQQQLDAWRLHVAHLPPPSTMEEYRRTD